MHRIFRVKAYEMEHGPHFNEEHARKAVMKMENEDGTRGPHWSLEETSALASQYGISLSGKFNRYDWFVALNMVYSDYYKVLLNITGSNNVKHYVEFAKAWLNDKDIDEGKMWYYYQYVMCDKIREAEMECYEEELEKHEVNEESYGMFRRGSRGGRSRGGMRVYRSYPLNSIFLVLRLMHKLRLSMISSVNLKCVKCRIRLTLFVKKIISQLCQLLSRLKQLIS